MTRNQKTNAVVDVGTVEGSSTFFRILSLGGLGLILVVAILRPADSVEVERGAALFMVPLVLGTWLLSVFAGAATNWRGLSVADLWFNGLLVATVFWLLLATISVSGEGNLRNAVNEWWWWVCAALLLSSVRNVLEGFDESRIVNGTRPLILMMLALVAGNCAFAVHQQLISLPHDRAMYEADPEGMLAAAGIDAPPGSPKRMLFEARLYGGGVTGTFALANSLAGLLVLGIPIAIGSIVHGFWHNKRMASFVIFGFVSLAAIVVLVWTDSRSAYLSLMIGMLVGFIRNRLVGVSKHLRTLWVSLFACAGIAVFVLAIVRGWWSLAPRSLAFRFQYWNATLRMVMERPWFGAGPGNYQQRYGAYRLDEASEGIADPHNWMMEILGAGGIVGLGLILAVGLLGVYGLTSIRERSQQSFDKTHDDGMFRRSVSWVAWTIGLAAFAGLIGAVTSWIADRTLPDFDGLLMFVLATACVYGLAVWSESKTLSSRRDVRGRTEEDSQCSWLLAGFTALGIHLLASGGFTVPGVAVPGILVAGVLLGGQRCQSQQQSWWSRGMASLLAVCLLVSWYVTAWGPTSVSAGMTAKAQEAVSAGMGDQAVGFYAMAADADRWDPQPLIGQTETLAWLVVAADSQARLAAVRAAFDQAVSQVIAREPGSAQLRELLGRQRVLLYQRFGLAEDLKMARQWFAEAVELSPGEVGWVSQLAMLESALGHDGEAERLAARAKELAVAGGHADRKLDVVTVMEVKNIGETVESGGPVYVSAEVGLGGIGVE